MIPASISAAMTGYGSGWRSVTWLPRRAGSRGVTTPKPSPASSSSVHAMKNSPSPRLLARIASSPACPNASSAASSASSDRIGGVPIRARVIPAAGV